MKKIFIILIFIIGQKFLFAQWTSVGTQSWDYSPQVLAADTTYVYAGGFFTIIGSDTIKGIAKWDGISWTGLGTGINGGVYALCVYNGILYAGGSFDTAGGVPVRYIAQWDGNTWAPVGTGVNDGIWALCIHNGELYAGGNFDSAGTVDANYIAKWDGSNWSAVGSGMSNYVNALASFQGNLYAGGGFTLADGNTANYIAKWDGSNWSALGTGTNLAVDALAANQSFLFAGGLFTNAGGLSVSGIAQWDGNNWYAVPGVGFTCIDYVMGFYVDTATNDLYPALYQSCPWVYRYDGTNWYTLCNNGPVFLNNVSSLTLFNGELYANTNLSGSWDKGVSKCSDTTGSLGVTNLTEEQSEIKIVPQPLVEKSILSLNEDVICNISFYDVFGRKINEMNFRNELIIKRNSFKSDGIYFYQVVTKTKSYYGKLLVQ